MAFDKAKAVSAAEKHLAQGKIPAAIEEYRRIAEQDANDVTALNTLGDLYARINKKREAIPCFMRVAEHYREQGFALKAIAVFKKVSRLDKNAPGVTRSLATLYEQQGLVVEARAQYLALVEAATQAGQARDALDAMRRIADLDPQNVNIRFRLAEGYQRENLPENAADAYAEAGARLLTRGDAGEALKAYHLAHELRPRSHPILQGIISAHFALGDAGRAAAVLEDAIAEAPSDLELRALLSRAYIESSNAAAADRAVSALVNIEQTNYPLLFDVARLYLQQGETPEAVRALSQAIDPALSGRQESALLELLNEALARDPEQIEALRLLLRIYTWLRDDERMRVTLERLAEAAQANNLIDEERRALEHLVRLVPLDQTYRERLDALGEPPAFMEGYEEDGLDALAPASLSGETPPAENVLGAGEPFVAAIPLGESEPSAAEFEWNTVIAAPDSFVAPDPSTSFADLRDDLGGFDLAGQEGAQEIPLINPFSDSPAGSSPTGSAGSSAGPDAMLTQELESVDYYLAQGYSDIARDTLDMLERQYGAHPEIAARRAQLTGDDAATVTPTFGDMPDVTAAATDDSYSFSKESLSAYEFAAEEVVAPAPETQTVDLNAAMFVKSFTEEPATNAEAARHSAPPSAGPPTIAPPAAASHTTATTAAPAPPAAAGIDAGLAAIFDEFREAVEETQPDAVEDYETHFNLGLAYKDMGLMDEAVEEFQTAVGLAAPQDGTAHYLQCCNMLGHCFMQKGMPRPAAMWFTKGLDAPGHIQDEYQALRYELGAAYEEMGELDKAIETYSIVYGFDVSYRGVAGKLRELQARKTEVRG
ncbi:MAG: tetratricopeptide repeat protein [Pyrinomonadaceae bacterium]|nr:tetratricopeptide repeat protein [Pyrinomonadaceae bacterium]